MKIRYLTKDGLLLLILCASKKLSKALFYVNKALAIDNQNRLYWKRYATINKHMNFFEEAEFGFRKAVEFGMN
jgi:tetratricopeptide (TPR) repeat protein